MTNASPLGRYQYLDFNAPLSSARANSLATALAAQTPDRILDIGCGWGELLLRTLAASPRASGRGIDTDETLLARATANAAERGLSAQVVFEHTTASDVHDPARVVICVGADHAFGSQTDALRALFELTEPGGRLLFGSGYWQAPPSTDQAASLGMAADSLADLAGLVDCAVAQGFRPLHTETASQCEWEQFESGYLADWEEWLMRAGSHPDAERVRIRADEHRNAWLRGYHGILGFAYLILGRPTQDFRNSPSSHGGLP